MPTTIYRLKGYDPFAGEYYDLGGEYSSYSEADATAREQLQQLELAQPSEQSGGQDGIQDRVYIVLPNGQMNRVI